MKTDLLEFEINFVKASLLYAGVIFDACRILVVYEAMANTNLESRAVYCDSYSLVFALDTTLQCRVCTLRQAVPCTAVQLLHVGDFVRALHWQCNNDFSGLVMSTFLRFKV